MIEIFIKCFIFIMNTIYAFLKFLPTQNKIVMISRQSNKINLDFKLLGEELSKKYKVVYLCKTLEGGVKSKISTKIKYGLHMFRQMYHLATSKVCILDSFCPAVSILKHKKKLTIIQMWHSIGTMKKFGYSILTKDEGSNYKIAKAMKMHKNYDVVYASSKEYRENLASGFGISKKKIKIYTLPRVDLLKNKIYESEIKNKIYTKYPQLKEKENILYAPTFRKNEKDLKKYIDDLIKTFNFEKYNLIIKMHPLSKLKIISNKAIIDKDFNMFDKNNYDVVRGIELDYNNLPGYSETNAKDLCLDLEKKYNMKNLEKFIKKYVTNTKNCTIKIVKNIDEYMK